MIRHLIQFLKVTIPGLAIVTAFPFGGIFLANAQYSYTPAESTIMISDFASAKVEFTTAENTLNAGAQQLEAAKFGLTTGELANVGIALGNTQVEFSTADNALDGAKTALVTLSEISADSAAEALALAQESLAKGQDAIDAASRALRIAQEVVAETQKIFTISDAAYQIASSTLTQLTPGTPEYNTAEADAQTKEITRGITRSLLTQAIEARGAAEALERKTRAVYTEGSRRSARAGNDLARIQAQTAVSAYLDQRQSNTISEGELSANDIPDVGGSETENIGKVTAACLKAAATRAVAQAITTRLTTLLTASGEGAATGAESATGAATLSVPITDVVGSTLLGSISGTEYTHTAQKTAVEPVLDNLAYNTAQCALDQLTNSIVNWIRGGFEGSPKYAVDTNQLFADYAGQVANDLARQIRSIAVCDFTPTFKNDLANAVELTPHARNGFTDAVSCPFGRDFLTFSAQEFSDDIQNGGWQAFEASLSDRGNPFGVTLLTNRELALRQERSADQTKQKLSWSNGFADIVDTEDCSYPLSETVDYSGYGDDQESESYIESSSGSVADFMQETEGSSDADVLAARNFYQKTYCKTTTPGAIVGDQLKRSLGVDAERLGFVDNMNKIIGALIEAIANKATDATWNELDHVFRKEE